MNVPTDSLSEHDSIVPSESRNRRQLAGWLSGELNDVDHLLLGRLGHHRELPRGMVLRIVVG